jgi:hypothetical protein
MRTPVLYVIVLLAAFACSENAPTPPPPHVTSTFLEVTGTDYTSVTLRLSSTELREGGTYSLTRNGLQVWEGVLMSEDTLITDIGLTASSDYLYRAYALQHGGVVDTSDMVTAHTRDTTSGDFTWEVFTFGDYNSILRDVYIVSPNDVWAVGKVYYNAPDIPGKYSIIYNALHWDGVKWDTLQMPTTFTYPSGFKDHRLEEEMMAVYAPEPDDVWFCGNNGVCRWKDGAIFEMQPPWEQGSQDVRGIWGTKDNLVFTTQSFGIRGWDGEKFYSIMSKEEIGGVYAQDVWGVDDTALVIVGDRDHSEGSKVYRVVNGKATVFPSDSLRRNMVTLWMKTAEMIFAGGTRLSMYKNGQWSNYNVDPDWGFIRHIRGVEENDAFAVGDFSTVLHYSGLSWQDNPEIGPERNLHFHAVTYNGQDVWAVGATSSTKAVILHGKRK